MEPKSLPVLYRIETFGPDRASTPSRSCAAPRRAPDFLVQLMVSGDADLRKALGRRDIAESRERAYGAALAARPSQRREITGTLGLV